jgi:hypothetical protein
MAFDQELDMELVVVHILVVGMAHLVVDMALLVVDTLEVDNLVVDKDILLEEDKELLPVDIVLVVDILDNQVVVHHMDTFL